VIGLGSCIGVCLYDPGAKIGGIAHVMLPAAIKNRSSRGEINRAKFGDTAVEALLESMLDAGALSARIVAKIVGGAHMFHIPDDRCLLNLGVRNTEAVKLALQKCHLPLVADDTGGQYGRTITLDTATGCVVIKTINYGEKTI
jgi:chemotaxis protein CheD